MILSTTSDKEVPRFNVERPLDINLSLNYEMASKLISVIDQSDRLGDRQLFALKMQLERQVGEWKGDGYETDNRPRKAR